MFSPGLRRRISYWAPILIVGVPTLAVPIWFFWPYLVLVTNRHLLATDFDQREWRESGRGPRARMVNDLIDNELPGKTAAQVIDMLGEPADQRFEFDAAYSIGEAGMDFYWLGVEFGLDSVVTDVALFSD